MSRFSWSSVVIVTHYAYFNFLNKTSTPFECKYQIVPATLLVFINASEHLIMVNNVVMPLNPSVALVKEKKLEERPLDVNVPQWSCEKKLFRKMVCIRVNHSTWDRRLSLNPHALTIFLKFVPVRAAVPKRFGDC